MTCRYLTSGDHSCPCPECDLFVPDSYESPIANAIERAGVRADRIGGAARHWAVRLADRVEVVEREARAFVGRAHDAISIASVGLDEESPR